MLSIDPLRPGDVPATAALHEANLRMGLFPKMGNGFLQHYHQTFADSPFGIALVAHRDDAVVGALFGTISNPDHYHWVVQNRAIELACHGSAALLLRPHLAWMFASTRMGRYVNGLRRHMSPAPANHAPAQQLPVLSHIVTTQTQRRRGIGRELVDEFKREARTAGAHWASLITQEGGLGTPFFERLGCLCVARRQGFDGCFVREYHMNLDEVDLHEEGSHVGARWTAADTSRQLDRPGLH